MTRTKIAIVVASQTGRTRKLADAIAEGAREQGAEVTLLSAEGASPDDIVAADALILGSGVHMAGIESSMRAFFERCAPLWMQGALIGKIGAAFVTSGNGARGGGELALVSLLANLAEHGMLLAPMHNRIDGYAEVGCHWGAISWTTPRDGVPGPTDRHLAAARDQGRQIARWTARWLSGSADPE